MAAGQNADEVLDYLSHTLTNKFLHQPSTYLRQASQDDRDDILDLAQNLFLKNSADDENKTEDK